MSLELSNRGYFMDITIHGLLQCPMDPSTFLGSGTGVEFGGLAVPSQTVAMDP